jgi:hypothetical protein
MAAASIFFVVEIEKWAVRRGWLHQDAPGNTRSPA